MTDFKSIEVKPHKQKVTLTVVMVVGGFELPIPGLRVECAEAKKGSKKTLSSGNVAFDFQPSVKQASFFVEKPISDDPSGRIVYADKPGKEGKHKVRFTYEPVPLTPAAPPKRPSVSAPVGASSSGDGVEFERRVDRAIEQVFGRRFDVKDPAKLLEVLESSFALEDGEVVRRSGLSSVDDGATVGGQARLLSKVNRSLGVIRPLLNLLGPLTPSFDAEDGSAAVEMFRIAIDELESEVGQSSGIAQQRIDHQLGDGTNKGALRTQYDNIGTCYGIERKNVVSPQDDSILSAYVSIGTELDDIARAWNLYKGEKRDDLATKVAAASQRSDILTEDFAVLKERLYAAGFDDATLAAIEIDTLTPPAPLAGHLRWIERSPGIWRRLLETGGQRGIDEVKSDVAVVRTAASDVEAFLKGEPWADAEIELAMAEVVASIDRIEGVL